MKSIIVREITSLVLRPTTPSAPTTTSSNTHIRFNDATPSAHQKSKPEPKKETNAHARYYATITYNQIVLSPGDREVALQLINVYFEMFKELLGEGKDEGAEEMDGKEDAGGKNDGKGNSKGKGNDKGKEKRMGTSRAKGKAKAKEIKGEAGFAEVEDSHSRLISAILTGVNRALPFAKISSADTG
jgi:ribosome biogenesis protein MAK21